MLSEKRNSILHGTLLIALFSYATFYIGDMEFIKKLLFSPTIIGIILGTLYANSLRNNFLETWVSGIQFCSKCILQIGTILYGLELTFQDVLTVELPAIFIDAVVVAIAILGGILIGRMLKMDHGVILLTSISSSICGAAAVLGAGSTIQARSHKTAVVVSAVVIFGTLSMSIYPILYRDGIFMLSPNGMGVFTGAALHEVTHTVDAGNAMEKEISGVAIIMKVIYVIMLVPIPLIISFIVSRTATKTGGQGGRMKDTSIPWSTIGFLTVASFNPPNLLPQGLIAFINNLDTLLLTVAMTALGTETSIDKPKKASAKPLILASLLYLWLIAGGYLLVESLASVLMQRVPSRTPECLRSFFG